MDEEPPIFLAYQPYKGPDSIPHVSGDFFGAFFLAANVRAGLMASLAHRLPRRAAPGARPKRRPQPLPTTPDDSAVPHVPRQGVWQ